MSQCTVFNSAMQGTNRVMKLHKLQKQENEIKWKSGQTKNKKKNEEEQKRRRKIIVCIFHVLHHT